jgi:DNA topoisomerase-2
MKRVRPEPDTANMKKIEYSEMDPLEHCLKRPDTYISGIRNVQRDEWIIEKEKEEPSDDKDQLSDEKEPRLRFRSISSNPGLERLFVEAQSNAIDNLWRSSEAGIKQTFIELQADENWTSVRNDGRVIALERHSSGLWNPELVFGRLRTSSNYDDTEERMTSGKNGLGIKLTNIYSLEFQVEIFDKETSMKYEQRWSDHMRTRSDAVLTKVKKTGQPKTSYTLVRWRPDFAYFSLERYPADMISLFARYAHDTAMVTGLNVTFNGSPVAAKTMKLYAKLLGGECLFLESKDAKVVISSSEEYRQLSFVNGCYTCEGGAHVDAWSGPLFRGLAERIEAKLKIKITARDIKKYFTFVVSATVARPEFSSQSKNFLVAPSVDHAIDDRALSSIMRWDFVKSVADESKAKEMVGLKKAEKRGYVKVEGLDPANFAGGPKARECALVICEGESAKTYTVAGLDVGIEGRKGRDFIGIYPIRGKILNTRNASPAQIQANREITGIRQALGLQLGVDYSLDENIRKLRYGRVVVVSDADSDGKHITGLLLNIFHSMYPSLLKRGDFLFSMRTPIMTIYAGKVERDMYTEQEYEWYLRTSPKPTNVKWRKGLGSSKREEVKKSFGKRIVQFVEDERSDASLVKAFDKKFADQRKDWLAEYVAPAPAPGVDQSVERQPISAFINQEFITFSLEDCSRSLPNIMDGLKESQRKVLFACFKKKLWNQPVKVAQLSGSVAEITQYHHGEQNLLETIVKLAQDFVGSNNLPYLVQDGQFGTRLEGGKDAAAARYIYTKLEERTRRLFPEADEPLLTYVQSDGESVEPEYYLPILPMVLVNGCTGIGTGWSSEIPCFRPSDLVRWIRAWLAGSDRPSLVPWYRNFKGTIEVDGKRAITKGVFREGKKKGTIEVTELPIGVWTNKYKDQVEDWYEAKQISGRANYSTVDTVSFVLSPADLEVSDKGLKLLSYVSMANMVAFNGEKEITRYDDVTAIMEEYCAKRLDLYVRRKAHGLSALEAEIERERDKVRFLEEVMDGRLVIFQRPEGEVEAELDRRGYRRIDGYAYLLHLPIRSFTREKVDELKERQRKAEEAHRQLKATDPGAIWESELEALTPYL